MSDLSPERFVPLFTQHSRHWRENRYVYPVISRRSRGLSVGVNLNPDKVCNFDCIYCCVDRRSMPGRVEVDLRVLEGELERMLDRVVSGGLWTEPPFDATPSHLRRLNDVAFSGDGEPTSYPQFEQACRLVAGLIESSGAACKIVVITNATLFHQTRVRQALEFLDRHGGEIWAKLDAGTEQYYRTVERTSVPFSRVLSNILHAGRIRPIVIQSLFMRIHDVDPGEREIDAYVARLSELLAGGARVKQVQVYTVARGPAESFVTPLPRGRLDEIVQAVRAWTGLPAEAFYGPD